MHFLTLSGIFLQGSTLQPNDVVPGLTFLVLGVMSRYFANHRDRVDEMIGWGGVRYKIDVRFGRRKDNGMMGFEVE